MVARKDRKKLFWLFAVLINLVVAGIVVFLTDKSINIVRGSDTMYHVYRGQWILSEIKKGNLYPLYNPYWYNGVELMRYWTPVAGYLMAFSIALSKALEAFPFIHFNGAAPFGGFCLYAGIVYLVGAFNWCYVGWKKNREWLGLVIGILYMFAPTTIYLFYTEGNLPRALIAAILPLLLYAITVYFEKKDGKSMVAISLLFALMVMCHVGYAGMVALSVLLYFVFTLVVTFAANRSEFKRTVNSVFTLVAMILIGFMITGLWLIPATKGGMVSNNSTTAQVAKLFFQPISVSLNPVAKYRAGSEYNYFGLAFFLAAFFGVFGSRKKQKPEFLTALLIFVLTSTACMDLMLSLPGGQFMWMLRFFPIITVMILFAVLKWDTLKRWILILMMICLVADSAQMLRIYEKVGDYRKPEDYFEEIAKTGLHEKAKDLVVNRVAFLGASQDCIYYYTGMNGKKQVFGQGWEAASTAHEITEVNEAYDTAEYYYMFDRLVELGADTVVADKTAPLEIKYRDANVDAAAKASGYKKIDENERYVLFHLKRATTEFGVVSKFNALAIGEGGVYMARMFPNTELAEDKYVDDYTVKELKKYKRVYLFKFKYRNVDKAEKIIKAAGKAGVEIYIMADGIPTNPHSQTMRFLGVECQNIQFENAFPKIHTRNHGDFVTKLFPEDLTDWRTVYLNGLDRTDADIKILNNRLSVIGTKYDKHIHFVGLNLTYFYSLTHDKHVAELLSSIMAVGTNELPIRMIVPIDVKYSARSITVKSDVDDVNTTLASHDSFEGEYTVKNHLMHVNKGTTVIEMKYPYFWPGLMLSLLGVLLLVVCARQPIYHMAMRKIEKEKTKEVLLK